MYCYYTDKLKDKRDRIAAALLYEGLQQHNKIISINPSSMSACREIFDAVFKDHPDLIHVSGTSFRGIAGAIKFVPEYIMDDQVYKVQLRKCLETVSDICSHYDPSNPLRFLYYLHDWILSHVSYVDRGMVSHTAMGPLLMGYGVCQGISYLVKWCCDEVGLPAVTITGKATLPNRKLALHAWNAIETGNGWYYYDYTFDLTLDASSPFGSLHHYDYFQIQADEMNADHYNWSAVLKPGREHIDYYTENNLVLKDRQDLMERIRAAYEAHTSAVTFKAPENWSKSHIDQEIRLAARQLAEDHRGENISYVYSINGPTRTMFLALSN